ncbi:ABC transporter atnG [Colletotrichum orbiculare MAFF 240422]|uniref:ABC transporter atnG n=1 Tax=Colletotrichum orbiculare (strain 104-T / ATCC 96160 / CBS 514.97 / LARS 414 / MAFF 240422) TaxID=1213857 RepID=N4VNI8_COLOR|nr:ABC transporter atnG [Colletotrichum orbiculare MAFF 240422]
MGIFGIGETPFGVAACPDGSLNGIALAPHAGCFRPVDFSMSFEQVFLSLLPCAVAFVFGLLRAWQLSDRPVVARGSALLAVKLIFWTLLAGVHIVILIWHLIHGRPLVDSIGRLACASDALALLTSVLFILVSRLEHFRSRAPSALLQTFLLLTFLADAVRVRTEWLVTLQIGRDHVAVVLLGAQLCLKFVLLIVESLAKPSYITLPAGQATREEVSGIFGKSLMLWINPLLRLGYRRNLTLDDLEPVDDGISGERGLKRLKEAWGTVNQAENHPLTVAVLKAFWPELLIIHIPRLAMVGFSLSQALLVRTTITYIQNHFTRPPADGYALIGAFALVYVGNAISNLWSAQLVNRLLTLIRGSLIAIVYDTMLSLRAETGNSQTAVALMGTEVERITVAAQWCVAIVPNILQTAFALWILSSQLGAVSIAPIIVAVSSVLVSIKVGQMVPPRQRRWMQAIQKRVGITTDIVGAIRGVKMSGLSDVVQDQIQRLRAFELDESKRFRRVQIGNVLVGQFPSIMTPSITLAVYAIAQKLSDGEPLNVVQAFTSLGLLSILIQPVSELVTIPNNLGSSAGCLDRIQEFLLKEQRVDYRQHRKDSETLIRVCQGSFGWNPNTPILHNLDLALRPSTLTIVVGPVGSGKSTLLKSLVGETYCISGTVEHSTSDVAYCDQDPWILNQSIKKNIIGGAEFNQDLYRSVIKAFQLEEDLRSLPQGDETVVGSSGGALSGGQKHRIALARAVYSGKQLIIMDDNLRGLDSNTASRCFAALFGPRGLLPQWLPFADQIITLDDGKIAEAGTYEQLSKTGGYVSKLRVTQRSRHDEPSESAPEDIKHDSKKQDQTPKPKDETSKSRGGSNTSALLYYIKSMGVSSLFLFLAMVFFQMGCRTMQRLWVKFWVADGSGGRDNLGMWVGVYLLWGVLTELSVFLETFYFLVVVVPHSAKGLHFGVLKAALAAPMSFFVKTDTGVIINRFSQDMNLVDLPLPLAFMLTFDYMTLAVSELVLTTIATGYLALAIPFLVVALYIIQHIYLQTSRQIRLLELESKSPIFSHFIASFAGLVTIRALSRTPAARAANLAHLDRSQRAFYTLNSLQNWLLLVLNLAVAGLAVLLVTLAATSRSTTIDAGLLGVALVSVMGSGQLLTMLLTYWASLETSLGAVARIREFEGTAPSERGGAAGKGVPESWPAEGRISFRDVSVTYDEEPYTPEPDESGEIDESGVEDGRKWVLDRFGVTFEPGRKYAICGRTGSGKSTILALLVRLYDCAGGIVIDGVYADDVPVERLRRAVVAVPQDALFLPGTVRRNLDPWEARDDEELWTALGKTGLKGLVEDKGGLEVELDADWLSAGQKQLFCLARAMLRKGKILLLDEATSSLDQATEEAVMELIRTEFKDWTVVVVAHRLRAILDFDKVVTLQNGAADEFWNPRELLEEDGVFASLWKLQEGSEEGVDRELGG